MNRKSMLHQTLLMKKQQFLAKISIRQKRIFLKEQKADISFSLQNLDNFHKDVDVQLVKWMN